MEANMQMQDGSTTLVAEPPKPLEVAKTLVTVSRDCMAAYLTIDLPEGAELPSVEDVKEKLAAAGVHSGILEDSISYALRLPGEKVLCAEGVAAISGIDACIIQLVDTSECGRPVEMEGGVVDFKNLNLYIMVEKGQVLAEKNAATAGTPGKDVLGREVPGKAGKDVALIAGKHMEVVDGNKLTSTTAGQLLFAGGKMNVTPVQEIKGDVDLSTGNIEFAGDVVIRGSVTVGFRVKASGNIDVSGNVSGATVEGDNVTIRMGIVGMNRGQILARGSVAAKFIENATVIAEEDIMVSDVVLHSHLSAGKRIKVGGKRGHIVGGVAIAGVEISAKSVGALLGTATELQAGINPKVRDEYSALSKEIKNTEESLNQINQGVNKLRSVDPMTLPPDRRDILLKLTRTQFTLLGQVDAQKKRMAEVEAALDRLQGGQIKVSDTLFPGVKIVIGTLIKLINEPIRFVVFYAEADEVKLRPFK